MRDDEYPVYARRVGWLGGCGASALLCLDDFLRFATRVKPDKSDQRVESYNEKRNE